MTSLAPSGRLPVGAGFAAGFASSGLALPSSPSALSLPVPLAAPSTAAFVTSSSGAAVSSFWVFLASVTLRSSSISSCGSLALSACLSGPGKPCRPKRRRLLSVAENKPHSDRNHTSAMKPGKRRGIRRPPVVERILAPNIGVGSATPYSPHDPAGPGASAGVWHVACPNRPDLARATRWAAPWSRPRHGVDRTRTTTIIAPRWRRRPQNRRRNERSARSSMDRVAGFEPVGWRFESSRAQFYAVNDHRPPHAVAGVVARRMPVFVD